MQKESWKKILFYVPLGLLILIVLSWVLHSPLFFGNRMFFNGRNHMMDGRGFRGNYMRGGMMQGQGVPCPYYNQGVPQQNQPLPPAPTK
ncbi:MAG: hypothetical protein ACRCSK_05175 [Fusobacteriaceae bacterium]